jgi:hypothetical protein
VSATLVAVALAAVVVGSMADRMRLPHLAGAALAGAAGAALLALTLMATQ